jgi:hypothetical protein
MKKWYVLIWLAFFCQPIFFNRFMYSTADLLNENFSIWTFIGNELRAGRFPVYDPYYLGKDFIGVAWTAVFYPLTMPLAYIGSFLSLDNRMYLLEITSLFHVFIASLTMDYLLKTLKLSKLARIFGSICFSYSSFLIIATTSLTHIQSVCWLPLVLALFWQNKPLGASIALSLSLLGGHPTEAIYGLEIGLFYALWVGRFKVWAKMCLFTFLICLVQIIPTMLHYFNSVRANVSFEQLTTIGSVPPFYYITLIFPHIFGGTGGNLEWGALLGVWRSSVMFCYMGLIPLYLFIISKARGWQLLALVGALMAMGKYSPLYWIVYKLHIPLFRNPASWLIFFCLGVAVASAYTFDNINLNKSMVHKQQGTNNIPVYLRS